MFAPALEGMKHVKSEEGEMLAMPFLDVCKLLLPVIGMRYYQLRAGSGRNLSIPFFICMLKFNLASWIIPIVNPFLLTVLS